MLRWSVDVLSCARENWLFSKAGLKCSTLIASCLRMMNVSTKLPYGFRLKLIPQKLTFLNLDNSVFVYFLISTARQTKLTREILNSGVCFWRPNDKKLRLLSLGLHKNESSKKSVEFRRAVICMTRKFELSSLSQKGFRIINRVLFCRTLFDSHCSFFHRKRFSKKIDNFFVHSSRIFQQINFGKRLYFCTRILI